MLTDSTLAELVVVERIKQIFESVPVVNQYCKVHERERFTDNDSEDIDVMGVPDLANPDSLSITSVIQIGIPTVDETTYSNCSTTLSLVYPITYDLSVVDKWDDPDLTLDFRNSRNLFMAVYMESRKEFKKKEHKNLGLGDNCEHEYLQQRLTGTIEEEETGKMLHTADWSLTVKIIGI